MSLRKLLAGTIPTDKQRYLRDHFDVVGDIAVVTIPPELDEYRKEIALAVISIRRNIRTVIAKSSMVEHEERVPTYEFLIGSSTRTEHKEFGFRYRLDLAEVFFSGRLSTERQRVIRLVEPGENVLVPFCGVGPFVIPAAAQGAIVAAVEKNPAALYWLHENLALNRVVDRVQVFSDDAFSLPRLVDTQFDRVICPTPYGRDEILDVLTLLIKKGGMFHFYTFKKEQQVAGLLNEFEKKGLVSRFHHRCGYVAPGVGRYVFDLQKTQ